MKKTMDILNSIRSQPDYQNLFADVSGYLHVEEGCALLALAAGGSGDGEVVEIGSYHGRSTCFLALGLKLRGCGLVHAVDHFQGSPEHQEGEACEDAHLRADGSTLPVFRENLGRNQLLAHVNPIIAASGRAAAEWDGALIRLLFIDGDHSYDGTKADFEAWKQFVTPGGFICFHDVGPTWPGVTRFFEETTVPGTGWSLKLAIGSLRVVQRDL